MKETPRDQFQSDKMGVCKGGVAFPTSTQAFVWLANRETAALNPSSVLEGYEQLGGTADVNLPVKAHLKNTNTQISCTFRSLI